MKGGGSYCLDFFVISSYLDSCVRIGRNEFNFPKDTDDDIEDGELGIHCDKLGERGIYDHVIGCIKDHYSEELQQKELSIRKRIEQYVSTDEGIEFRHIIYSDDLFHNIKDGMTDKQLYYVLQKHKYQQSLLQQKKKERLLKRDYSNSRQYQDLLKEYIELCNLENSSILAKYVCHRKVIIELMEKYLAWSDRNHDYNQESMLHNLIFTMGETDKTLSYDKHNLWLLDDRLTFHRYLYSDKQIRLHIPNYGHSDCKKETDIAIYDVPFCYDEESEYGDINSIVVFELKRPDREVSVNEYKTQMKEQVMGIREGRKKKYNGTNFQITNSTPIFFYYVIDDNSFVKLKDEFIGYEKFRLTPYNSLISMDGVVYEEILTYKTLLSNAKRRNLIFFKKLGI